MIAFRLQNYRGFEDTGWIDLKPLTLLVGPNNTGKSSLLRFLPLLRQSVEFPTRGPFLWNKEGGLDFGSVGEVKKRGSERALEVQLRFDLDLLSLRLLRPNAFVKRHEYSVQFSDEVQAPYPSHIKLMTGDRAVELGLSRAGDVSSINGERPHGGYDVAADFTRGPVPSLGGNTLGEPPPGLTLYGHISQLTEMIRRVRRGDLDGLSAEDVRVARVISAVSELRDALASLELHLRTWASQIAYLGPARENPQRYYRQWEDPARRLDPTGRNLPLLLHALPEAARQEFNDLLMERLGYRIHVEGGGPAIELSLIDAQGEKYNLIDLGFGFSQVLPVYLQAFIGIQPDPAAGREVSAFAVEQPELHLHPRHQAQLADLFGAILSAARAARKTTFPLMVETHSEALIDRLGELIYEKKVEPEDVQVLIFEKHGRDCTVRKTSYDDQGVLIDWPPGFLAR